MTKVSGVQLQDVQRSIKASLCSTKSLEPDVAFTVQLTCHHLEMVFGVVPGNIAIKTHMLQVGASAECCHGGMVHRLLRATVTSPIDNVKILDEQAVRVAHV